jgi:hypothetical protein
MRIIGPFIAAMLFLTVPSVHATVCSPAGADPCLPTAVPAPPTPWLLLSIVVGVLTCRYRTRRERSPGQSSY